jgi:hypothetical protein
MTFCGHFDLDVDYRFKARGKQRLPSCSRFFKSRAQVFETKFISSKTIC